MRIQMDSRVMVSLVCLGLPIVTAAAEFSGSVTAKYAAMPIRFEANKGQAPAGVDYSSAGSRHSLYLDKAGVRLSVPGKDAPELIELKYRKPETAIKGQGVDQIGARSSYIIGPNPDKWITGISSYRKVRYNNVWRGIDVLYYGNEDHLEYDLVVGPGKDLARAAFDVSGVRRLKVDGSGDLLLETASGDVVQHRPVAYQQTSGGRREVTARYRVSGHRVSFEVGEYDHGAELIVDPVLAYSLPRLTTAPTLQGTGVVADLAGNAWIAGNTVPLQTAPNVFHTSVFVVQVNQAGTETGESVTFGAPDGDVTATGIATDYLGSVYLTGTTNSTFGFPLMNAYQVQSGGGPGDAWLARLSLGSMHPFIYGTYLGGNGNDVGNGIAADSSGHAYIVGQTASANFPATGGSFAGGYDAFLTKINTNAAGPASLVYSQLSGGSLNDAATSVALDFNGFLYIGGFTQSTNFQPNPNFGYVTANPAGNYNGYVEKVSGANAAPSYLTFFAGGPVFAIAVDRSQQAFVTGQTDGNISLNSVNPGYGGIPGAGHGFVARFSTTVSGPSSLIYSSYIGGSGTDSGNGIVVDGSGFAFVVGNTMSTNLALAGSPLQSTLQGPEDGFLAKFNTNAAGAASLVYSTYLGGSGIDTAAAVGLTAYANPVITGGTASPNFPVTPGKPQDGGTDNRAYATKFYFEAPPFGSLDTPANGSTNVAGAVNVTGWALSSIAISSIGIYRAPVNGETGLVFIGNANQVPGARPDVAKAYPGYPNNNWGWGLQVLTNVLPGVNGAPLGNGTYTLYAIGVDNDGESAVLGTSTITVNNAGSTAPFGTIDIPTQGAVVRGTITNVGWALTPQPAAIPSNGVSVYIDGHLAGQAQYNEPRPDVAGFFPNYANSSGPGASFTIDTTKYANGLHTISWLVTDNQNHMSGIGSRYFTIQN